MGTVRTTAIGLMSMILSACQNGMQAEESNRPPTAPADSLVYSRSMPYRLAGERLLMPMRYDSGFVCSGDTLKSFIDSIGLDTVVLEIGDSALGMIYPGDTYRTGSGAVIELLERFRREGPGQGLLGGWRSLGWIRRVASGTPTDAEQASLDSLNRATNPLEAYFIKRYVFEKDWIRIYSDYRSAALNLAYWNGTVAYSTMPAESLEFDMDAGIVDKYTIQYRGRKTGETVRRTDNPNGDTFLVSDNPSHPPASASSHPSSCASVGLPAWYSDFRNANRK
jgi:hypothetical protein